MRESKFRSIVVKLLAPIGAFPVENTVHSGMPDVCCVLGWIELKVAHRPGNSETIVSVDLRPAQRLWLKKWSMIGGAAWTLTLLGDTWFLHSAKWAHSLLGRVNEKEMKEKAIAVWTEPPSFEDMIHALKGKEQ